MNRSITFCLLIFLGCGDGTAYLGTDAATPDRSIADQASTDAPADVQIPNDQGKQDSLLAEAGVDTGPAPDQFIADLPPASAYKIVISEFLPNPAAVTDANGEWLELYNDSTTSVDLTGWMLKDEGKDDHIIAGPLVIAPGAYVVLTRKEDPLVNGGVTSDYTYSGFTLSNQDDEILLLDDQGFLVDRVAYVSSWKISPGQSVALQSPQLDNALFTNWCYAQTTWLNSAGDQGTPGEANDCTIAADAGMTDAPPAVVDAGLPDAPQQADDMSIVDGNLLPLDGSTLDVSFDWMGDGIAVDVALESDGILTLDASFSEFSILDGALVTDDASIVDATTTLDTSVFDALADTGLILDTLALDSLTDIPLTE
jgi:hypothetical protein